LIARVSLLMHKSRSLVVAAIAVGLLAVSLWLSGVLPRQGRFYLVIAFAVIAFVIWYLPKREVRAIRAAGVTDPQKLAELQLSSRTSIIQAIGGFALIATLAVTAYQAREASNTAAENIRLAERGQVSERLSRSVEQLGATVAGSSAPIPAVDVRVGALFALAEIGEQSETDTQPALLIVATYIAGNLPRKPPLPLEGEACSQQRQANRRRLRRDVQIALEFVLPRLEIAWAAKNPNAVSPGLADVDFSDTILPAPYFRNITLSDASFRNSDLSGARFDNAIVQGDFRGACLQGASFSRRQGGTLDLRGADLRYATVTRGFFELTTTDQHTQRAGIRYRDDK
jgi:Pentapeptide repeats (8 copies)